MADAPQDVLDITPVSESKEASDDYQQTVSGETASVSENDEKDLDLVQTPFSTKTIINDTALVVEGEKLYVSKHVLGLVSPVFRAMFAADMAEKNMDDILLPGKRLSDMREFLLCVYPDTREPITVQNSRILVPLFTEYQVDDLRTACELTFAESCTEDTDIDTLLENLLLSLTYNMEDLRRRCIQLASTSNTSRLRQALQKHDLPYEVKVELWENVTMSRDSDIQSLIKMCELLPSRLETSVSVDRANRYVTVDFKVTDRQMRTRHEIAKYISAIQTTNEHDLRGMQTILLDTLSPQMTSTRSKDAINNVILSEYMTEEDKTIFFEKL